MNYTASKNGHENFKCIIVTFHFLNILDTLTPVHGRNVVEMYGMLRDNGFKRRNIKVFYASGMREGITGICLK